MDSHPRYAQPEPDSDVDARSMPPKRPFGVTLLLWMVLSLSVWGLLRFFGALGARDILTHYRATLSPQYLSLTGGAWTVAGAVVLWRIWTGKRWSLPAIPIAVALWLVEYWIERIFFEAPRANLPFMIGISIFLVVITLASTFNRKTKNFLLRSEEHEQPESHSIFR